MTFVVVKKLTGHQHSEEIDGMMDAGEKINDILNEKDASGDPAVDYKDVFDRMYADMTGGKPPDYSVNVGAGGGLHPLSPAGGKHNYEYDGNKKFKLKPQEDKENGQDKAMTFVVPEERTDLLSGSAYITQLVGNVNTIANNKLTPAEMKKIAKYLLANVFLTRCH